MFYQTQTARRLPKGLKNAVFRSWWPWPLTFKLVRARDQTRLPCEFVANPFGGSRDISYTNKKSQSAKNRTLRSSLRAFVNNSNSINWRYTLAKQATFISEALIISGWLCRGCKSDFSSAVMIIAPETSRKHSLQINADGLAKPFPQRRTNFNCDWHLNRDLSTFSDSISSTTQLRFERLQFYWRSDLKYLQFDLKRI